MNRRLLITAGPTREHLDPVRYISNGSSGRMGYALAAEAAKRGWDVDLVSGPVALEAPHGVRLTRVVSADDMLAACESRFDEAGVFLSVAAVADFKPAEKSPRKTKKAETEEVVRLVRTVDVLKTLAARRRPGQVMVGFAAETHDVEAYARRKLEEKNLDWIVANDVSRPGIGMEAADNTVTVISRSGHRASFGPAPKSEIAARILDLVLP
ncbi:MAG: phosphopantothenoylcysteine decarboxylase [Opitutaceae bacterium]|nr:phosphopantothenoylcysteine decarboxylase [Opitutaceae bacterium]